MTPDDELRLMAAQLARERFSGGSDYQIDREIELLMTHHKPWIAEWYASTDGYAGTEGRVPKRNMPTERTPPTLTPEQTAAVERLSNFVETWVGSVDHDMVMSLMRVVAGVDGPVKIPLNVSDIRVVLAVLEGKP